MLQRHRFLLYRQAVLLNSLSVEGERVMCTQHTTGGQRCTCHVISMTCGSSLLLGVETEGAGEDAGQMSNRQGEEGT